MGQACCLLQHVSACVWEYPEDTRKQPFFKKHNHTKSQYIFIPFNTKSIAHRNQDPLHVKGRVTYGPAKEQDPPNIQVLILSKGLLAKFDPDWISDSLYIIKM